MILPGKLIMELKLIRLLANHCEEVLSDPYLADKLRGLLKMVCWERNNSDKRKKIFSGAIRNIENAGSIYDTDVIHVLDEYAREFRKLNLFEEAETLERFASKTRVSMPDKFDSSGRELDWWEQPHFINHLPGIPVEFHSSRTQPGHGGGPGGFLFICFVVSVTLGIPYATIFAPLLKRFDGMGELFFMFCIVPGITFALYKWRDSNLSAKGHNSSCHITIDGIQFREPSHEVWIGWNEMEQVWMTRDPHPDDDDCYDVVEVTAGRTKKFRMSDQFFLKDEVKMVYAMCMLKQIELGKR